MDAKEKKDRKCGNVLSIIIVVVGIITDIVVETTGKFWIPVTESYMDYIYAAIITISVLCFSFVALISGFLDKTYYGYKLRDILQFKESPVNFKYYIRMSLGAVVLATVFLAGDFITSCANSLTALLMGIICFEGNIAFSIYEIMTNDKLCYNLVIKHFGSERKKQESDFKLFQVDVDRTVSALKVCIKENDFVGKDAVCNMLLELGNTVHGMEGKEDYYKYYDYFTDKFKETIYVFTDVFGYNEMIKTVISIYSYLSDFEYGRIDLYTIPLDNMRFWGDQRLIEKNYFKQIIEADFLDEYKKGLLTNREIERIFYCYFENVLENRACSVAVKEQVIEAYIKNLAKFHWITNEEGIEPDSIGLLNVLKYFVLKNENVEERNYIFQVIIREIFYNNNLSSKEKYFDFLSIFFQAFYAYIFCEVESLNENYRNSLKDTFVLEFSTATLSKIKASWLLKINIESILEAMGRRIVKGSEVGKRFEYFPPFMMAKSVVWSQNFDIDYLFMLYLIYNDEVGYYSVYSRFFNWEEMDNDCKILVLKQIMDKFNFSTGLIKEAFLESYMRYGEIVNHTYKIPDFMQKKLFEHIAEEHGKIIQEKLDNAEPVKTEMDYGDILNRIDELMKKESVFGWSSDFSTDFYIKFVIPDCICRKEYRTPQSTARTLQHAIIDAVEKYIQRCTNKLVLTFDLEGINKLLAFVKEGKYDSRNYSFTEDWSLSQYNKETDFITLVEEQNKIELVKTPRIRENMFFRKDNFKFNVKISKMEFLDLTENECAEFLENSKSYNGLYNVDGALMSKEKAIESVQKLYCREKYAFKLMISFKRDEVTHIDFEH